MWMSLRAIGVRLNCVNSNWLDFQVTRLSQKTQLTAIRKGIYK
jgi:hypothetical protein